MPMLQHTWNYTIAQYCNVTNFYLGEELWQYIQCDNKTSVLTITVQFNSFQRGLKSIMQMSVKLHRIVFRLNQTHSDWVINLVALLQKSTNTQIFVPFVELFLLTFLSTKWILFKSDCLSRILALSNDSWWKLFSVNVGRETQAVWWEYKKTRGKWNT